LKKRKFKRNVWIILYAGIESVANASLVYSSYHILTII